MKILVIEDERLIQEMLRKALRDVEDVERVDCVRSILDAADAVELVTYDIVILDLRLPDERGPTAVTRVKALARDAGIIVFSGADDEIEMTRSLHRGAIDYIPKGSDLPLERIMATARNYLASRRLSLRGIVRSLTAT